MIVTVTPDEYVNKGPGRPVFPAKLRAEAVAALRCVDEVQITSHPTAAESIRQIRPNVYAKGPDYDISTLDAGEKAAIEEVGAELLITQTEKWSSTALLNRSGYPPEAERYLETLRRKYSTADVRAYLDKARALKVLVIGDAIRDEYHYVDTLGKSGKDPILAAQFVIAESFRGGVDAVCQHAKACADTVARIADITTVKRRFVEQYPFQKLFEIYDTDLPEPAPQGIEDGGRWSIERADVVLVADFGHGFLTPERIERIEKRAKYLAVNVQANAGNHGFNTISKYLRAHFVSTSERELRLDARDSVSDVTRLAVEASLNRNGATVLVTRGEKGCVAVTQGNCAKADAPALTTHAVDRTGAGDAVFAVTACLASVGMPLDLLTFMASIVGTQAVGIVGNARYIERASLWAAIEQALG